MVGRKRTSLERGLKGLARETSREKKWRDGTKHNL